MATNPTIALDSFNSWIGYALSDLASLPGRELCWSRRHVLEMALGSLKHALKRANELKDAARKALCLRIMSWIRADLRRAV